MKIHPISRKGGILEFQIENTVSSNNEFIKSDKTSFNRLIYL